MLADELDYVLGVDTHRDERVLSIVTAPAGAVVAGSEAPANLRGYRELLRVAARQAPGRRAWAIEGTGSYGAGLARFLAGHGGAVLESAAFRGQSGGCAVKTMRSTRRERRGQHLPVRRSRCRGRVNGARRCDCC